VDGHYNRGTSIAATPAKVGGFRVTPAGRALDMATIGTRLPWLSAVDRVDAPMSPFVLHLLRRGALYAIVAAVALLIAPRALREFGIMGEDASAVVERAGRAVDAARAYGASPELPALRDAAAHLAAARDLLGRGEKREARRAAAAAAASAVEAQRAALVAQQEEHRRAEAIVEDVDKQLNDLEKTYTVMTTGLDKAAVAPLFSLMKAARAAGGGLTLAYEQGDYGKVLRDQPAAAQVIESTRATLRAPRP
jgi:hypothetical protein